LPAVIQTTPSSSGVTLKKALSAADVGSACFLSGL
jgi:hypothetical protein